MTLLELVQAATGEMGLAVPTYVLGNTNQDTIQQLALMNAAGRELRRQFPWQAAQKEYRFTTQYLTTTGTTAVGSAIITGMGSTTGLDATYMATGTGIPQDCYVVSNDSATQVTLSQAATAAGTVTLTFGKTKYTYPSDFDSPTDRTQWDKSKHWEMLGPETPQQWQWLKSGFIATGPRLRWRPLGGYFQIWPLMATAEYLGFEYNSKSWVVPFGDIAPSRESFAGDADGCIFPDDLMILALKLKYFEVKGFDTTALYRDYTMHLDLAKANDKGAPMLSMAPNISDTLISWDQIPDSGYGS